MAELYKKEKQGFDQMVYAYLVKRLREPIEDTDAFGTGIVDERGAALLPSVDLGASLRKRTAIAKLTARIEGHDRNGHPIADGRHSAMDAHCSLWGKMPIESTRLNALGLGLENSLFLYG